MRKSGVDCCYHYYQYSSLESTSIDKQLALVSWRLEINLLLLFVRVLGFGGGEPFRTNQISPFLVPLVFFSFSLARSLTLMLCSRMSLVRACCVRGQRERETERQRQTELFFLFLCTQPKVPTKVGGVPKNKTREQQAQAARQKKTKRRDFTYLSRERERDLLYIGATFSRLFRRTNQKTKKQNKTKNISTLFRRRDLFSPSFWKTNKKQTDAIRVWRHFIASFVGDVLLRTTTTPTFCFERRRRYPSEENNNGDSRAHRYATLLITRATQSRDFWFHRQRVTTRLLFSV